MTDPQFPRIRTSVLSSQAIGDAEKVCQSKDCRHLRAGIKQDTNLDQPADCGDVVFAPHFVIFAHLHVAGLGVQMSEIGIVTKTSRVDETAYDSGGIRRALNNGDAWIEITHGLNPQGT